MPRSVGDPAASALRIRLDRLLDRLDALAQIGAISGTTGCARLALTDEDRAGRDLVVSWMRDLGLDVTIDGKHIMDGDIVSPEPEIVIQLNDDNQYLPVAVSGLTDASAIAAGGHHSCALLADGSAQCWGSNFNGQLGNGSYISSNSIVSVSGLSDVAQIQARTGHRVACFLPHSAASSRRHLAASVAASERDSEAPDARAPRRARDRATVA